MKLKEWVGVETFVQLTFENELVMTKKLNHLPTWDSFIRYQWLDSVKQAIKRRYGIKLSIS